MRRTIANAFTDYADQSKEFLVLTADLGYSVFDDFRIRYPEKFFNMGIAEGNMVGVAAGLAMSNKKVFVYSIASFLAAKCFEQIRDDVCYHNVPVVLVGTGSGFAYGQAGYTHYSNDDIAILRTIPDLVILSPSDPIELRLLLDEVLNYNRSVYLRVGKNGESNFSNRTSLKIGEAYFINEEKDVAIVTHGNIIEEAVKLRILLKEDGLSVSLVSSPTIKPLDVEFFNKLRETHSQIVVVEEHYEAGGLGSVLQEAGFAVEVYGVKDRILYEGGDQGYLRKMHGIDADSLYESICSSAKK